MNEHSDDHANDADGWPLPSRDVLRELEPPAVVWLESEPAANRQLRPPGTG
jgi:hypothetical protein